MYKSVRIPDKQNPLIPYKDGVNTPNYISTLLNAAVGYEILPTLRASVEYHNFFDKAAGMAVDMLQPLKHDIHEFWVGAEIKMAKRLSMNILYFWTNYSDYNKAISEAVCTTYSRINKVFGLGIDYKF